MMNRGRSFKSPPIPYAFDRVYPILTSRVPDGASDFTVCRAGRRIHEACGGQVVTARDIPSEAAFAAAMWAMAASRDRADMAERNATVLRGADL